MSARLHVWHDGVGVTTDDLNAMTTTLMGAPDRATEQHVFPGNADGVNVVKRLRPLLDERRPAPDGDGLGTPVYALKTPRVLGVEAAYYDNVSIGKVAVLPHVADIFAASGPHDGQALTLSATLREALMTAAFASSVSGRVDTVYVSVKFTSAATVNRRVKSTTTGEVTTQALSLYADPEVSVNIAPGTEGSSTPGAVPADGGGQYNIAVVNVALPVGYTTGGVLFDGGGSFVTQVWERGNVHTQAVEGVRNGVSVYTSGCDAGPAGNPHTALNQSPRGTGHTRMRKVFRHTAATAVVVLDNALDWRGREVRLSVLRSASHVAVSPFGNYVPPSLVTAGGASMTEDSGWVFSGYINDVGAGTGAFFITTGPPVIKFFARNADGALVATIADAPLHVDGDFYTVVIEAFDNALEG